MGQLEIPVAGLRGAPYLLPSSGRRFGPRVEFIVSDDASPESFLSIECLTLLRPETKGVTEQCLAGESVAQTLGY